MSDRQRVVVVTGGGGGIGAAIAESIGRTGDFVVTVDPLVSVDGSEHLPNRRKTPRDDRRPHRGGRRIRTGLRGIRHRRIGHPRVVRPTGRRVRRSRRRGQRGGHQPSDRLRTGQRRRLAQRAVGTPRRLSKHPRGRPTPTAAGRGRILGVTSGSGWRSADAGAYGCAKRAVASLTWQLGRHVPPGVVVDAISPTPPPAWWPPRWVVRCRRVARPPAGCLWAPCPAPAHLGPLGAHLVGKAFTSCRGRVLFAGGSEVAVIDEPRLIEVVGATTT